VISVWNERHGHDARLEQLPALLELQGCARLGQLGRHITHGDRSLERRREAPAGDLADLIAFPVEDQGPFAHGLATVDFKAHALLRGSILQLGQDPHCAGEAASPRRRLLMAKVRPAITGVVSRSRSWP